MLASLYNGNVHVWNYESQTLVKTFEVTDLPGKIGDFLYTVVLITIIHLHENTMKRPVKYCSYLH